jgi:protein MpaA
MTRLRGLIAVGVLALLASSPAGAVNATAHADATVRRTVLLGYSVDGRPITAIEAGDPDTGYKTLVVGCIHGNEPAGIAIADRLASTRLPAESDLWIVANLNPDGVAAGTRGNANSVDLNRNFPSRWQRLTGTYYSGPRPLSEPETRIAYRLIERVRPAVSIWFHQHLDLVDDSTGNRALERRFARPAGLRLAPLAREPEPKQARLSSGRPQSLRVPLRVVVHAEKRLQMLHGPGGARTHAWRSKSGFARFGELQQTERYCTVNRSRLQRTAG